MSESDFPIPPPTFEFLVFSLKRQAELHLGLFTFGEEKNVSPDLPAARHLIDLLGMLADKTRGNLSLEEQRSLENSLTELRFRFVQISGDVSKAASAGSAAVGSSEPGSTPAGAAEEEAAK